MRGGRTLTRAAPSEGPRRLSAAAITVTHWCVYVYECCTTGGRLVVSYAVAAACARFGAFLSQLAKAGQLVQLAPGPGRGWYNLRAHDGFG